MARQPSPAELLEALAAAVVEADADDRHSVEEVHAAFAAALAGQALPRALADEAKELLAELSTDAAEALKRIAELLGDAPAAARPVPEVPLTGAASAHRDGETIELIGDFLEEGTEGLARADEMLLAIERGGVDAEKTNALFRVFHTIKGVAGFLELAEIVSLAHITETLLNQVREGKQRLEGQSFDVVFESTASLRRLLESLRKAVDGGTALAPDPEVPGLVKRIEAAILPESEDGTPAFVVKKTADYVVKVTPAAPPAHATPDPAPAPAAPAQSAPTSAAPAATAEKPTPAPAERTAAPTPSEAAPAQLRDTVKVDLERVDSMVEMIGELIIVESMVIHAPEIARIGSLKLRNYLNQLSKISRDLQNVAMRMRMVPVRGAFQKMARLVRDLSRKTGKDIVLEQSGEDTEMDRSMVERIEDPLVHLVRNSVDHGIEPAAERASSGKPARAVIKLSAYHEGGSIVVELADDGRGLARDKILKKAREKGLIEDGKDLTDAEVHALIFLPGFSTAAQVTEISGRGVGMDVVKRNIEGMRGRVSVLSKTGQGTSFRLVLPLTLAIIDGMLVACGAEKYIIPSLSIVESLRPTEDMISRAAGHGEIINVRGEILPLLRLHHLLQMRSEERVVTESHVVVVEGLGRKVGLVVDDVLTQQQVVIKPLGSGIGDTDFLSGAAILSDGRVGLILNVDRLAVLASRGPGSGRRESLAAGA